MKNVKNVLVKFEEYFLSVMLLATTLVLFVNVLLRYFLNASQPWAEEFIRYAMIWISFLAASTCFRNGMHYGVDLILRVKSKTFVRIARIFIELCCLVFSVFLLKYGWEAAMFNLKNGQVSPALRMPTGYVYLIMPISGALSILYEGVRIFHLIRGDDLTDVSDAPNPDDYDVGESEGSSK